jgi:hypothetical protein
VTYLLGVFLWDTEKTICLYSSLQFYIHAIWCKRCLNISLSLQGLRRDPLFDLELEYSGLRVQEVVTYMVKVA